MTKPRTKVLQEPRTWPGKESHGPTEDGASGLRRGVAMRTATPRRRPAPSISRRSRKNIARMVEEGGKALAAYLKPREEGEVKIEPADEIADVVKTLGQVAEYWLSDPQRAVEVQAELGKAYLELWAAAVKRMAGESAAPVVAPDPRDKRFADPEWSSNQFYDFLKQAYLLTTQWADRLVKNAQASTSTRARRPSSTSSRSATRSRRRTSC